MELFEREFFVYRLLSTYQKYRLISKPLKIRNATPEILYEAQEVYLETLYEARQNDVATEIDIDKLMRERGMWSDYDEDQMVNVLPKHIEYWKVEIYQNFVKAKERKQLEVRLEAARNGLSELFQRKHVFDHYTQHGLATFARWQRIVEDCTVNYDGSVYGWEEVNINQILEFISHNAISESQIREVVRTEPWKSMWLAGKRTNSLIGRPSVSLSDDLRRAINWAGQYDNIVEFPDAPTEAVFNHDDAFDGWMILKNREIEKNKAEDNLKKRQSGCSMDAPEVIMVMNQEDKDNPNKFIDTVYGMNDPTSRFIVNNRLNTIKNLGTATDAQFADIQRDITRGAGHLIKGK